MLATPLLPPPTFSSQHDPDDSMRYRPSRDIETFNSLLPPPIEFIEGSSSGALAVPEGKYEPINSVGSQPPSKTDRHGPSPPTPSTSKSLAPPTSAKTTSLYSDAIDMTWPAACNSAAGLFNSGNTCFLNSALQCLLHTPPLLRIIIQHNIKTCRMDKGFCMSCNLREVIVKAYGSKAPFAPSSITNRLQTIAKHMRKGRQEDTHEFLRYAIDALQKSCLAGHSPKIDPKIAETTWVHKVFGGRLRSRVTCRDCGHNSDTFDSILDLSLDIHKSESLRDALRTFVAIDYLRGADKYKCEKCKKHVVAEKRFTIHEAPLVLTVHFKRFSPMGRKISHHVNFEEHLSLKPFMSEDQHGPSYSLYGIICHAGGGPNSGHYYAFVKAKDGQWWEMNDEMRSRVGSAPTNKKTAYMLFYIRNKGQGLDAAVKAPPLGPTSSAPQRSGLAAGMKKRKERDSEVGGSEDMGVKVSKPFGPLERPSTPVAPDTVTAEAKRLVNGIDPQAALIKSKIEAAATEKARRALAIIGNYDSDSDEEDKGRVQEGKGEDLGSPVKESERPSSPDHGPPMSSSPAIPTSSFYGTSNASKKRKSPDTTADTDHLRGNIRTRPNELTHRGTVGYRNPYNITPVPAKTYLQKKSFNRKPRGI